jgi:hypothetical protein
MDETRIEVNAEYVSAQLARALSAVARAQRTGADGKSDFKAEEQAKSKLAKWMRVASGILTGQLNIGSRVPVVDVPAWATLEVSQGGFATGRLLAEGEIQDHELKLAEGLNIASGIPLRAALNAYFLSTEGMAKLNEMLASKRYRIDVPEESALLVVAYLFSQGANEAAKVVVEHIAPFFSRLRFYPIPSTEPLTASDLVYLQSMAKTRADFSNVKGSRSVECQREALSLLPLYDRAVSLFAETIEDGWPCQTYPESWNDRATKLLFDLTKAESQLQFARKKSTGKGNAAHLFKCLSLSVKDRRSLSGRDVGMIRAILQQIEVARGLPGSTKSEQIREVQRVVAAQPGTFQLAPVMLARIEKLKVDALTSLSDIFYPITAAESESSEAMFMPLLSGCELPETFKFKALRSVKMPLNELIESELVSSSEQLAGVVTQISAQVQACAFDDQALQALYAATYSAFKTRRSLLLFNLAKQVQISELPWVNALEKYKGEVKELAKEKLTLVCATNFKSFPQQLLPNKLIGEIASLAKAAGLTLPIVEELAADIFMGKFSPKFTAAAALTAKYLKGTIYFNYYSLSDFALVDSKSDHFAKLCQQRAGVALGHFSVAANGAVIEQEQILTSHNLAALFSELKLSEDPSLDLEELVKVCFVWICREQQGPCEYSAQLRVLKNTAYAWRQMIFFLSLLDKQKQDSLFVWMDEHMLKQDTDFSERFSPILKALKQAQTEEIEPAQRFVGWTTKRHILAH